MLNSNNKIHSCNNYRGKHTHVRNSILYRIKRNMKNTDNDVKSKHQLGM